MSEDNSNSDSQNNDQVDEEQSEGDREESREFEEKEKRLEEKESQLEEREKQLEKREEEIEEKLEDLEKEEKQLEEKDEALDEKEERIEQKQEVLDEREKNLEKRIEEFEQEKQEEKQRIDQLVEKAQKTSNKPQTAGGILLIVTGILTLVGSFWFLASVATGTTPLDFTFNPETIAGLGFLGSLLIGELLETGITVSLSVPQTIFTGVILLILAIIEIVGGWQAYQSKHWYFTTLTGILALILILPLGLISIFLTTISETRFSQTNKQ